MTCIEEERVGPRGAGNPREGWVVSEVGMIPEVRKVSKMGGGLQDGGGPRSGRFSGHKRPKKHVKLDPPVDHAASGW